MRPRLGLDPTAVEWATAWGLASELESGLESALELEWASALEWEWELLSCRIR